MWPIVCIADSVNMGLEQTPGDNEAQGSPRYCKSLEPPRVATDLATEQLWPEGSLWVRGPSLSHCVSGERVDLGIYNSFLGEGEVGIILLFI